MDEMSAARRRTDRGIPERIRNDCKSEKGSVARVIDLTIRQAFV